MFEKFSNLDIDSAGRGGEYTVQVKPSFKLCSRSTLLILSLRQAGFGWTNGVLLWIASNYGSVIAAPQCPNLLETPSAGNPASGAQVASRSSGAFAVFIATIAILGHLLL